MGPDIIVGRSPECQITIDDPLVSRQHARIMIRGEEVRVVDLGSRNGVRVNGNLIRGEAVLKHNDRVRLGTQDLVFLVVDEGAERLSRSTGYMMHCQECGRPFPGESATCPHCGAPVDGTTPNGIDTLTGFVVEPQTSWTFQLLGEIIDRALAAGRAPEAERMFQRAAQDLSERVNSGAKLDPKLINQVVVYALRLSALQSDMRWAGFGLDLLLRSKTAPSHEVVDHIEALAPEVKAPLCSRIQGVRALVQAGKPDEAGLHARLTRMVSGH